MHLTLEQLPWKLRRQWPSVLLVSGDESFQIAECLRNFRELASEHGFTERVSLAVDQRFCWSTFVDHTQNQSLFAKRKIIELHMASGKPGSAGSQSLVAYADNPNPDVALLIVTPKLDRETLASKWYKCIDAVGYTLKVWPIPIDQMPQWVAQQARHHQLRLTPDAIALLAERSEGNPFAAAQEIMKASLLYADSGPETSIDAKMIAISAGNSAHYSTFDLIDSTLAGNTKRCLRILDGLCDEGESPLAVLGTLTYALRNIAEIAERVTGGQPLQTVFRGKLAIWQRRRSEVQRALSRHPPHQWTQALVSASDIDRLIKHAPRRADAGLRLRTTDEWAGLRQLIVSLCGHTLPGPLPQ